MKCVPKTCIWTFIIAGFIACAAIDWTVTDRWLVPGIQEDDTLKIIISSIVMGISNIVILACVIIITKRIYRKFHPKERTADFEMHRTGNVGLD